MEQEVKHSTRDRIERSARELLYGTTVFFPARTYYQSLFNRQKQARRRKMQVAFGWDISCILLTIGVRMDEP